MKPYRAWAQLNWDAKEEWRDVFPDGKIPIKPFTAQAVRFDGFRDPESVFCVDWNFLADWQRDAFLKKLSEDGLMKLVVESGQGVCFLFGRSQVCLLGVGKVTFWGRGEVLI